MARQPDAPGPRGRDFFALFGLPAQFAIDVQTLEQAYRQVLSVIHPDRHASGSDVDRRLAMQLATDANTAYRVLRDPCQRAAYLCEQRGVAIDDRAPMPAAFLGQQMEWREQLESARRERDPGALQALRKEVSEDRMRLLAELTRSLDDVRNLDEAAALVRKLMFLDKFSAELDDSEELILNH